MTNLEISNLRTIALEFAIETCSDDATDLIILLAEKYFQFLVKRV